MKKILYLHQYFQTNASNGGTRSYEFAKYLSNNDIEVTVITGTALDVELINNEEQFTVVSTNTKYNNKMSKWSRILAFLHYNFKALMEGLKSKNVDIVFATSTPLTIGFPAVLISRIKRKKLIFEVRDVWPDVPIKLGYIKNKFIIRILKTFELWIYKNSEHIIVLSNGMLNNLIKKGIDPKKVTVIENMANLYLFDDLESVKKEELLKDKFVCIHPGTMGHVNGLDFVLDVAKETIKVDEEIIFLLIGDGKRKDQLMKRVEEEKLFNVQIRDSMPKSEIAMMIKAADVGIMCIDNKYKILEDNSANKFFDFVAAGLPIVINYEGWQKEIIESENCGKSILNPVEMASEIIKLKNDPEQRLVMAMKSRQLAEKRYSDVIAKRKFMNIIKSI